MAHDLRHFSNNNIRTYSSILFYNMPFQSTRNSVSCYCAEIDQDSVAGPCSSHFQGNFCPDSALSKPLRVSFGLPSSAVTTVE